MATSESVALVTGGSAGIGANVCELLLADGYRVLNLSRRPSGRSHDRLVDVQVDLSEPEQTRRVLTELTDRYAITRVVHNAGVIRPAALEEVKLADLEYLTRLHLHTSVLLMQSALEAMKAAQFGRFVVITSRAMLGLATRTAYAATKSGQLGLVRTWALELGQHGVTVNAIAPGPIVTDMFTEIVPEDSDKARALAQSIPVRRLGRPDDVGRAVMFLLSADNGFITGQNLFVCGGASVGSLAL